MLFVLALGAPVSVANNPRLLSTPPTYTGLAARRVLIHAASPSFIVVALPFVNVKAWRAISGVESCAIIVGAPIVVTGIVARIVVPRRIPGRLLPVAQLFFASFVEVHATGAAAAIPIAAVSVVDADLLA